MFQNLKRSSSDTEKSVRLFPECRLVSFQGTNFAPNKVVPSGKYFGVNSAFSGVNVREINGALGGGAESRKSRSIYVFFFENKAFRAYARRG